MSSPLYGTQGRLRGHFVYALQCSDTMHFLIKIGNSVDPMMRLDQIRTHCPYQPEMLATMNFIDRTQAIEAEAMFHSLLSKFRTHGEWFAFEKSDKVSFNQATAAVRIKFSRPSWPLRWVKVGVAPLVRHKAIKRGMALRNLRRRGKAYADATKDWLLR